MISLIHSLLTGQLWPCPPGCTYYTLPHPILYFGNEDRYKYSKSRIVTLSLNPSDKEFKGNRFPLISGKGVHLPANTYKKAYDDYFDNNPYWQWFSNYEHALNGLNASYHGVRATQENKNTALHIDLVPVATKPVWRHLSSTQQKLLINSYQQTMVDLIDYLNPHYILTSIARDKFKHFLSYINATIVDKSYYVKNNTVVTVVYKVVCPNKALHTIIVGINRNTPFAHLSHTEKEDIVRHSTNPTLPLLSSTINTLRSTEDLYVKCKI